MKKILFVVVVGLLAACESDDIRTQNPFLVDISFQAPLNTDLPQYSSLNFPNNSVVVPNAGLRGFVIFNIGNDQYRAFELSDPNHSPNDCSRMQVEGFEVSCPCPDDNNAYSLTTGEPIRGGGEFGLKMYRTRRSGNTIIVSN
jgi:nitrite reductase/ring-hydroxylating ferredoxin subunit